MCVTWLIHMCDVAHSYVWHDSYMCVTWLFHLTYAHYWVLSRGKWREASNPCPCCGLWQQWDMTNGWMSHATLIEESCHISEWVVTHISTCWWVVLGPAACDMNETCHTCEWVMRHLCTSHVAHLNESCHIYLHMWMWRERTRKREKENYREKEREGERERERENGYVWHDSFKSAHLRAAACDMNETCRTYAWVIWIQERVRSHV